MQSECESESSALSYPSEEDGDRHHDECKGYDNGEGQAAEADEGGVFGVVQA